MGLYMFSLFLLSFISGYFFLVKKKKNNKTKASFAWGNGGLSLIFTRLVEVVVVKISQIIVMNVSDECGNSCKHMAAVEK